MEISNTPSNQNFGMALKINPSAKNYLEKCSDKMLEELTNAGKELKGTKYCNMEITNEGPIVKCGDYTYKQPFKVLEFDDNYVNIYTTLDLANKNVTEKEIGLKYADAKAARKAYSKIVMESPIVKATEITKNLESQQIEKIAQEKTEAIAKQKHDNIIANLFKQFGTK